MPSVTLFVVLALCLQLSHCFDTGPHSDLTADALGQAGFNRDMIRIAQFMNYAVDLYGEDPMQDLANKWFSEKITYKGFASIRNNFNIAHFDNLPATDFVSANVKNFYINVENIVGAICDGSTVDQAMEARIKTEEVEEYALAIKDKYFQLTALLGMTLHAMQDFYTHSNFVDADPKPSANCDYYESIYNPWDRPLTTKNGTFRLMTGVWGDAVLASMSKLATSKDTAEKYKGFRVHGNPKDADNAANMKKLHKANKIKDDSESGIEMAAAGSYNVEGKYPIGLNKDSPTRPDFDRAYLKGMTGSQEWIETILEFVTKSQKCRAANVNADTFKKWSFKTAWKELLNKGFDANKKKHDGFFQLKGFQEIKTAEIENQITAGLRVGMANMYKMSAFIAPPGQNGHWRGWGSGYLGHFIARSKTHYSWIKAEGDGHLIHKILRYTRLNEMISANMQDVMTKGAENKTHILKANALSMSAISALPTLLDGDIIAAAIPGDKEILTIQAEYARFPHIPSVSTALFTQVGITWDMVVRNGASRGFYVGGPFVKNGASMIRESEGTRDDLKHWRQIVQIQAGSEAEVHFRGNMVFDGKDDKTWDFCTKRTTISGDKENPCVKGSVPLKDLPDAGRAFDIETYASYGLAAYQEEKSVLRFFVQRVGGVVKVSYIDASETRRELAPKNISSEGGLFSFVETADGKKYGVEFRISIKTLCPLQKPRPAARAMLSQGSVRHQKFAKRMSVVDAEVVPTNDDEIFVSEN